MDYSQEATMNDQLTSLNAADLLQKLLDERFQSGHEEGLKAGYEVAMREIRDEVQARLDGQIEQAEPSPEEPTGTMPADDPADENDTDPPITVDYQPPYFQRALQYVQLHPGVTAQEAARGELKNRNVLYILARLGLVEKHGTQFFPKNAAAEPGL